MRAQGRIVDGAHVPVPGKLYFYQAMAGKLAHCMLAGADGKPLGPSAWTIPFTALTNEHGTPIDAAAVSDADRRGYFDVPDGLPEGIYWIDVHPSSGGEQRWAWPYEVKDGPAPDIQIGGPSTGVPGGEPDPNLAKHFTPGTYTPAVSLYGLLGAPLDRAKRDLSRFRAAGFGNARVWIDWDHDGVTGSSCLDAEGNWIEPVAAKMDQLMIFALSIGMSFDLTMHASAYNSTKIQKPGEETKYDITQHKRAVRRVLERWGQSTPFRILDMANECEVRGAGGHGSPDTGHVSPGRFNELMTVARSVPRKCLASCSVSSAGDKHEVTANYQALFRDTKGEILLVHYPRVQGWGWWEGTLGVDTRKAIPGLPLYNQEPARNGHSTTPPGGWPLKEFEDSFTSTRRNGSVGCCFHTAAGFDMRSKDAWDQLDGTERQVVANLKGWLA